MIDYKKMPAGKEKYHAYLASHEWAVRKQAVRLRSNGMCERCRIAKGTQTHHMTYIRLYNEKLEDLLHVCRPCHEFLSGVSTYDPAADVPLMLGGKFVESVYLAGKMRPFWRDEIAYGWSDFEVQDQGEGMFEWRSDLKIKVSNKSLCVTGPYISPFVNQKKHESIHWSTYTHLSSGMHNHCKDYDLVDRIRNAITECDFVFAWINSSDCFGTLVEIGFAIGIGKTVYVATHDQSDIENEMWLAKEFMSSKGYAHDLGRHESAKIAWDYFSEYLK